MRKKEKQWKIDRGFNFNEDNINRIKDTLLVINKVDSGLITQEAALEELKIKGLTTEREDDWKQSKATCYKAYGLICEPFKLTEISKKYISGEINFKELMLQQILKKEFKYDDQSEIVHPLVVILYVLYEINKIDPSLCWIDSYDYLEHLTEVKKYSDLDKCVKNIINNKNKKREIKYETYYDYDIWCSAFISTNLFKYVDESSRKITLNFDEINLIELIINNKNKLSNINEFDASGNRFDTLYSFGDIKGGIYDIIDTIGTNKTYQIDSILTFKQYRKYVKLFLIDGLAFKKIEQKIFERVDDKVIRGFFSQYVLNSLGLVSKDKGSLNQISNYINLIKINNKIFANSIVHDCLFKGENYMKKELKNRKPRPKNRRTKFNQILYGAPGTGKTYSTPEYAMAILDNIDYEKIYTKYKDRDELKKAFDNKVKDGFITFTTFHQSYGYEDFIQGMRPDLEKKDGTFVLHDGVFKSICEKAMNDNENDYVIIIDEINRGNISRIFGELITLIEDDKRWGEKEQMSVILPSDEPFAVPNNLYILGTMNSADKSISLVDAALRRRFGFIEKYPSFDNIEEKQFVAFLEEINKRLFSVEHINKDLLIGQSYFIGKNIKEFADIVNNSIIPLLYEYFFDNEEKVAKALDLVAIPHYEENGKTYVFKLKPNPYGRYKFVVEKKEAK